MIHPSSLPTWRRWAQGLALLLGLVMLGEVSCQQINPTWKTPNMTPASPRVAAAMAKPQTYCFDRFLIDVPQGAEVIWAPADVPFRIEVYPGRAKDIPRLVAEKEAELKAQDRMSLAEDGLKLYVDTVKDPKYPMTHVLGYETFSSRDIDVHSYLAVGDALVRPGYAYVDDDKKLVLSNLHEMLSRLRLRDNAEIPTEPGLCIEHAFLADAATSNKPEERGNFLNLGFRLGGEFADVHFSMGIMPTNEHESAQWTLDHQMQVSIASAREEGRPHPYEKLTFLRQGKREIGDWKDGYEVLTMPPDQPKALTHHDFIMRFRGFPDKALFPHIDIEMQSGIQGNRRGKVKPSLSNDEAVALWDLVTGSIRPRPTSAAKKVGDAAPSMPLGTLAATGRICLQTGLWRCAERP